jgi:hypothetical protein
MFFLFALINYVNHKKGMGVQFAWNNFTKIADLINIL